MKIVKAIKLFKKLKKQQEFLYNDIVEKSQEIPFSGYDNMRIDEYAAVNKAVSALNEKIPNIYLFIFYDIKEYICYLKKH